MSSLRRVVCGTELGEADQSLASEAARLARTLAGELVLVHASVDPPSGASEVPESVRVAALALEHRVAARLADESGSLEREAARLRETQPNLDVRAVLMPGRPHEVLARVADATDDALLVVGRRPARPLGRTIDHLVRHARSPVLAVPSGASAIVRGITVAVAFDASDAANRALRLASELAAALGGNVIAIHACGPAEVVTLRPLIDAELRERAPTHLTPKAVVVPIETTVVDAVVQEAARRSARLIAIGSHARRGIARAILGSTAESLLHRASTAVLVVR